MILLANLTLAIGQILGAVLSFFYFVVIVSAILSWVNPDPYNPIVRFLSSCTEPILQPIRRYMPFRNARIDISPLILILVLLFLQQFLVQSIIDTGNKLRSQALMPQ